MIYDLDAIPFERLLAPIAAATAGLVRLDERISRSPFGEGLAERMHFSDACASLYVDGELVHIEDLVLHDAGMGIRTPTHELTIAHDVLRSRRRIAANPAGWAVSPEGLASLRGGSVTETKSTGENQPSRSSSRRDDQPEPTEADDPLGRELAEMDALLARSEAVLSGTLRPEPPPRRERDVMIYEPDWDEDERLEQWHGVVNRAVSLPPVLRAAIALDAWEELKVLQHAPWLGRLVAASLLWSGGVANAHLPAINIALRSVPYERRRSRNRDVRLRTALEGLVQAAELGLKEHDRLLLARQALERKLVGRRTSSRLPQLIDLVLSRPMVSAGMIAAEVGITSQAAIKLAVELELRELTGRGRFRAWGVL